MHGQGVGIESKCRYWPLKVRALSADVQDNNWTGNTAQRVHTMCAHVNSLASNEPVERYNWLHYCLFGLECLCSLQRRQIEQGAN